MRDIELIGSTILAFIIIVNIALFLVFFSVAFINYLARDDKDKNNIKDNSEEK